MNEELTPLEALEKIKQARYFVDFELNASVGEDFKEEITIIKKTLEEKEQQDSVLKTLREVIKFGHMLPHIEPNKDNGFDIMSAVSINIQRDIENKERELLRQWVLETCFPKELKALEIIKENLVVGCDENENDKPCLIIGIKVNRDKLVVIYQTNEQDKIDLLKEVLL